jgi:hypothetical protein
MNYSVFAIDALRQQIYVVSSDRALTISEAASLVEILEEEEPSVRYSILPFGESLDLRLLSSSNLLESLSG